MANNFQPTSITATTTWQKLATLLASAGYTNIASDSITSQDGYFLNNDTTINLRIGFGTSAPTYYATAGPKCAILFNVGMNVNEVWISSASSTVAVDFVEGASAYIPPLVNGVIGTITATTNVVPKADASGALVASSIIDDATTVTASEPIVSAHATTPYFETASGKTNTGYVNIKGKTSGAMKFLPADATAQTVTIATAAQTVGATTLTIPDQANVSSNFVFDTLAQTLASKTLTSPVISTGLTASGSAANTFVGSTGTFITSSGANTLSGAVDVNAATTPSITLNSGKTNTGFVLINGKTSGSTKIITADSTAQAVVISTAAQTVGGSTLTIPDQAGASSNFVFTSLAQALTNKTETLAAGTTAVAPLVYTSGTNLTSAIAGATEFDGVSYYGTIDTSSGRGAIPSEQYFRLTSAGGAITTIANYFGATSNISLVASAFYEIEIYAWYLNTTSGTLVWTLTNSAAPTSQNIFYESSPAAGIVAPPGTATALTGAIRNDATAALALSATGNLTDATSQYTHMRIWLQNGTGTSLKIQATKSAGSITPGVGSYWKARRLPASSTGTFSA